MLVTFVTVFGVARTFLSNTDFLYCAVELVVTLVGHCRFGHSSLHQPMGILNLFYFHCTPKSGMANGKIRDSETLV